MALALVFALCAPQHLFGFSLVAAFAASYGGNLHGKQRVAVVSSMAILLPLLALMTMGIHQLCGGGLVAEYVWILVVTVAGIILLPAVSIGPPGVMFLIVTTAVGWAGAAEVNVMVAFPLMLCSCVSTVAVIAIFEIPGSSNTFNPSSALQKPVFHLHQFTQFVGVAIAGLLCLITELSRIDWAMLTSSIILSQSYKLHISLSRSLHRLLGTGIGLAIFFALSSMNLPSWAYLFILPVLQFWIESTIAWRYTFAVAGITPLVLSIGLLTAQNSNLVSTRAVETLLGLGSAIAVASIFHYIQTRHGSARMGDI